MKRNPHRVVKAIILGLEDLLFENRFPKRLKRFLERLSRKLF